jgi:hypothetical protein
MKNLFTAFIAILVFGCLSFAPKGSDDVEITFKGKKVATYDSKECLLGGCAKINIKDLEGNNIISIQADNFRDPSQVSNGNPQGNVYFMEWTFFKDESKCETTNFRMKKFQDLLDDNQLFDENGLSDKGVKNFVLKNGMKFSANRSKVLYMR